MSRPRGPDSPLDLMEQYGIGYKSACALRAAKRAGMPPAGLRLLVTDMQRVATAIRAKTGRKNKRAGGMPALGMRSRQRGLRTAVWPGLETT